MDQVPLKAASARSNKVMAIERIGDLIRVYRAGLLENVIPFWMRHALDREHGGVYSCLDGDGAICGAGKAVWMQGRFVWMMATLVNTAERRPEWLAAARSTLEFIERHCYDADGRMFFRVTRQGQPLRKRR
jgi:N-acylglucosamine 2-epimerase